MLPARLGPAVHHQPSTPRISAKGGVRRLRTTQSATASVSSAPAPGEIKAVTGIPSYFWVDGYDGAPINETVTGFGVTVAVSITLGTVEWDFGDGTPHVTGGLGRRLAG